MKTLLSVFIWYRNNYIEKVEQGIVRYTKSKRDKYQDGYKDTHLNRRLQTKRIRTHLRK